MLLTIKRIASTADGVFGVLVDNNGEPFALTGERAWHNNKVGVSCIPSGRYTCKRIISPRFGETFEITNVPNRTHILLHKGNIPHKDSMGCILVGEQFGYLGGDTAVLSSKKGFNEFMSLLEDMDSFILDVMDCT